MDKLSDITKDYLADFEVLTEAREEFESQLDAWWHAIISKHLVPALTELNKAEPNIWDNQKSPGQCHCRVIEDQMVLLEVAGPRTSNRGCYTVTLYAGSMPTLKKLRGQKAFVKRFDALASQFKIGGTAGLNWSDTELASEDSPILPDDPEETVRLLCDAALRYFRLVIEHHRAEIENPTE